MVHGRQHSAVAACAAPGVDPEWFWPESPDPLPSDADWLDMQRALALCALCTATESCRALFWTQRDDAGGIWFGTTQGQRARARVMKGRAA